MRHGFSNSTRHETIETEMPKDYWDQHRAERYDEDAADKFSPEVVGPAVDFLADLAVDGHVLEFAIGTGRIALPLSERGVQVQGIELSPAMVKQLKAKSGAAKIDVAIGDMATTRVDGEFRLAYLVYNTITNLLTQEEQVLCFQNAAAHLEPGGYFVIEVHVPELQRLPPGETARVSRLSRTRLGFKEYDVAAQRLVSHHYWTAGDKEVFPSPHRYVWPSELDLMAQLADMTLRERWSDWNRKPFTSDSTSHVSVWEKTKKRGRAT
jgi:SAM-dependent methyltransferase